VELRLTANLPLRRRRWRPASSRLRDRGVGPGRGEDGSDALRGPGEASIESLSAWRHPAAEFSSAYRAHGVASDVLCRSPPRTGSSLSAGPARWSRQARLRDPLVKEDRFVETRTPSLDECLLPRDLSPCGARARDRREPATVPAALPPWAGFGRPFTLRARGRGARPRRVNVWTRHRSSTSATSTACEHNRRTFRIPSSAHCRRSSPGLRWTGRRPPGRG